MTASHIDICLCVRDQFFRRYWEMTSCSSFGWTHFCWCCDSPLIVARMPCQLKSHRNDECWPEFDWCDSTWRGRDFLNHHDRWKWQCWDMLHVVSAEDSIIEFIKKLSLRFGPFIDSTQICIQGDNLPAEMTICQKALSDWILPRTRRPFRVCAWTTSWGVIVTCYWLGAH